MSAIKSLAKRLATESMEESEAKLLQLSTNQRERLADETVEQKEARLPVKGALVLAEKSHVELS